MGKEMEKLFSFFKKTFLKKRILFHIFKRIIFFSSCDFVLKINHNCYNGNFYCTAIQKSLATKNI